MTDLNYNHAIIYLIDCIVFVLGERSGPRSAARDPRAQRARARLRAGAAARAAGRRARLPGRSRRARHKGAHARAHVSTTTDVLFLNSKIEHGNCHI